MKQGKAEKIDYSFDELLALIKKNYEEPDLNFVQQAYDLASAAHAGKMRQTGHDYIVHPLATAYKLAQMKLGMNCLAAGLLHDVVEDTGVTLADLKKQFGADVANLVDAVTKLKKVRYVGTDVYAENMRRMFLAMASDVRVVFIKFADRLHNLKTLYARPREKQLRIAREVLEIYGPIANRLGMGEMRGELEDLAFAYFDPKAYEQVSTLLERKVKEKEKVVNQSMKLAEEDMLGEEIKPISIHGRVKRLYSLHRKLEKYKNDITKIYDIIAVRIIVSDVSECYAVLGVLHKRWKPLAGRIKDYIAQPKPNGYQSLHTTVFGEHGGIVEFQIRTQEMHEHAEYGVAAHWRYKEDGSKVKAKDMIWMDELAQIHKTLEVNKDFLGQIEKMKLEIFKDRIFVFTPKGDVIDLPDGSTPVDFAYAIHTDIGDKCMGARINDKMVNLDSELQSGDMCEIVIDKNRKGPNADWLKFAKTHHAREKIRDATRSTMKIWLSKMVGKKTKAA
ncbi:MAG: RelA/SpoT family protein [Patescibacteria group bacterium]